jgi:hypothetical protein
MYGACLRRHPYTPRVYHALALLPLYVYSTVNVEYMYINVSTVVTLRNNYNYYLTSELRLEGEGVRQSATLPYHDD